MSSDLRFAVRQLLKSPGFTAIAIATLALGIGLNTSMFSLVNALLFRSAPFPESDRLVRVYSATPRSENGAFAYDEIEEMRAHASSFESLTTFAWWNNTLAEPGQPAERRQSVDASEDFFTTFGIQPALGRAYTADEQVPGRNRVVILSHAVWQERFGGDPDIVNRTIRLNAEQVTVIGVMPAGFGYPFLWGQVDLWRPMTVPRHIVEDRTNPFFQAVGRLKPGVTPEQAAAELAPLTARWTQDHPETEAGRGIRVVPLTEAVMDDTSRSFVWMLYGLAGFVLLIACANLANLQLARATGNMKDLAIRAALGASRSRLIVHQLVESLLLALAGGALGIGLAYWVNFFLSRAIRVDSINGLPLPIDGRVLTLAVGVSLFTGILFGLVPAWLASRADVVTALKAQSRGTTAARSHHFMRHTLIVAEVALALVLLAGAGVMIRGFDAFLRRDHGWDSDRVLVAIIHLPEQSTYDTEDKRRVAIEALTRRLAEIPGAERTGIGTGIPLFGYSSTRALHIEGQTSDLPGQQPSAGYTLIASDYLETLGLRLLDGRVFPADIRAESPQVVLVNETLARQFWPRESAVGKRLGAQEGEHVVWREIIGVVSDVGFAANPSRPNTMFQVYRPLVHEPWGYMNLVVRGPAPATFGPEVRRAVADIDRDVAVQDMYTIPQAVDRFQHNFFVVNDLMAGFAALGLVLAAVGLYGVVSNIVAQRTGEFGIRMALGARRAQVLGLVMGKGMRLTLVGLAFGSLGVYGLLRFLDALIPLAAGPDPVTLGGVAAVLLAAAVLACWAPAHRATQVSPLEALRSE